MKCEHCGKDIRPTDDIYLTDEDKPICAQCFFEYYETCRVCGVVVKKGSNICKTCRDVVFKKVINPYSTKVGGIFKNRTGEKADCLNDRYFGYEMEYSNVKPECARISFKEQYDNKLIYNKSDSSLSGGGVEIVTIPMTRNNINKLIDEMDFETFTSMASGDTSEGAGVHIHVSRNTISPIDVIKLSLLFNGEPSRKYKGFIYYIVGRIKEICNTNLFNPRGLNDGYYKIGEIPIRRVGDNGVCSSHGLALNLQNKNTVEFRLFKSTSDKEQLKSYLEFTERAIEFVEKNPINMISIKNFIAYLYLTAENTHLRYVLERIKTSYPDFISVKPVDYSSRKYLNALKDVPFGELEETLTNLLGVPNKFIDWDEPMTLSLSKDARDFREVGYVNKHVHNVMEKIKEKLVKSILTK